MQNVSTMERRERLSLFDILTEKVAVREINGKYEELFKKSKLLNFNNLDEISKQFMYAHGYKKRFPEESYWKVNIWEGIVKSVNKAYVYNNRQQTQALTAMNARNPGWESYRGIPLAVGQNGGEPPEFLRKLFNKLVKRNKVFPGLIYNDNEVQQKKEARRQAWAVVSKGTNVLFEAQQILQVAQTSKEELTRSQYELKAELNETANFAREAEQDIIEINRRERLDSANRNFASALEKHRSARKNAAKAAKRIRQMNSFEARQKIAELPYDIRELLFVHWLKITYGEELLDDLSQVYYGSPKDHTSERMEWRAASEGSEIDLGEEVDEGIGTLPQSGLLIDRLQPGIDRSIGKQINKIKNIKIFGTGNMLKQLGEVIMELDDILASPDDDLWIEEGKDDYIPLNYPLNPKDAIIYQKQVTQEGQTYNIITIKVSLDKETDAFKYTICLGGDINGKRCNFEFDIYSDYDDINAEWETIKLSSGHWIDVYNNSKTITEGEAKVFGGKFDRLIQQRGGRRSKIAALHKKYCKASR